MSNNRAEWDIGLMDFGRPYILGFVAEVQCSLSYNILRIFPFLVRFNSRAFIFLSRPGVGCFLMIR